MFVLLCIFVRGCADDAQSNYEIKATTRYVAPRSRSQQDLKGLPHCYLFSMYFLFLVKRYVLSKSSDRSVGSVTSLPFLEILKARPTGRPT